MSMHRNRAAALGPAAILAAACLVHCGDSASESPAADAEPPPEDAAHDAAPAVEDAGPPSELLPPTEGSGTRFRVMRRVTKYSDGSVLREGAFFDDRQLGHSCSLYEVAPDRWACLPSLGGASDYGLFSDPACTNAVLSVSLPPQSSDPTYVGWGEMCARKFTLASPLMKKVPAYRKNPTTDACELAFTDQNLTPKVEIPASTFGTFVRVADQVVAPERDGSRVTIVAERLVSDDGAFQALPRRLVDRTRNAIGTIALASDLKRRVLTTSYDAFASGWFGNPTCTQAIVGVSSSLSLQCHDEPLRAPEARKGESITDSCSFIRVVRRPTEPTIPTVYYASSGSCLEADNKGKTDFYPAQPFVELAPQGFAEVTTRTVPTALNANAGSMLEPRVVAYATADGLELRDRMTALYLRKWDVPCAPDKITGEVGLRCIPRVPTLEAPRRSFFADAACTKMVSRLRKTACDAKVPPLYIVGAPNSVLVFARPPGPAAQPGYVRDVDGACVVAPDGYDYVDLTDAKLVESTDFPLVTGGGVAPD